MTINPEVLSADEELERRIAEFAELLIDSEHQEDRRDIWETLKKLIALRSPGQIARMEARLR